MQGIDLPAALALLLIEHASGGRQHAGERDLLEQIGIAVDLAADVADHAAEVGFARLQAPGWRA